MKLSTCRVIFAIIALLALSLPAPAHADGKTFNVKDYGAVGDGTTDDTKAIQAAVKAAIADGSGNTVLLPAGTFLIASGPIHINDSKGLTFTGASAKTTMIWYARIDDTVFNGFGNSDFTLENFSADVQKLPATGLYDLGITQGTVTSIDAADKQITVKVEPGYPLMNRPDIVDAPKNGYGKVLWTLSDPARLDFDGNASNIRKVSPSPDGASAVLTLDHVDSRMFIGEEWLDWPNPEGVFLDIGYGNSGTTTLRNFNYYGGGVSWMGIADSHTGVLNFKNLYCGPPPYQPDRHLTCNQGWAMNSENRAAINISDSTFLQTWDDVFDIGSGESPALSQPAPNQVIVQANNNGDYKAGDTVEFTDDSNQPMGTIYGQSTITAVAQSGGNPLVTLDHAVPLKNPGKDFFTDLTQAGPITATNCTFSNSTGRHVYFRSGKSVTVTNCTFLDGTPLICGGWDGSEGPSEVRNITVTGCTFKNSSCICQNNFGNSQVASGSGVLISGNRFITSGRVATDGGWDSNYAESQPVEIANVTGVTISNNWFDRNWGANVSLIHDANVKVSGNTFDHPNEINPHWASASPDDTSVVYLENVAGGALSGNIVSGAGPYTEALNEAGKNVSGVSGLANGTVDIDNPLTLYLPYDNMVLADPAFGPDLRQVKGTGATSQTWLALPVPSAPGGFTLEDAISGQSVSSASQAPGADIVIEGGDESPASPSRLWRLARIDGDSSNIVNGDGLALHVKGDSKIPGARLIQWTPGSAECQDVQILAPPHIAAIQHFGTDTVSWASVAGASSYGVSRAAKSGGPYAPIASGLTSGPYIDRSVSGGKPWYYVVTAAGLPTGDGRSNEAMAVPDADYVPVDIAPACTVTGIEPSGWKHPGSGFDGQGDSYLAGLTGRALQWDGKVFALNAPAQPDVASDAGQRIYLPPGLYSHLLILGAYMSDTPEAAGTFHAAITYADGSSAALSQGMTSWRGKANQSGESDAASYPSLSRNGSSEAAACYVHGYSLPLDPAKTAGWLTLANTGKFRILAIDLSGVNRSILAQYQSLVPGQYIVSPNGKYFLTQQSDGNLALWSGSGPTDQGRMLWSSSRTTAGSVYTTLQPDGNLVTYPGTSSDHGSALWATDTNTLEPNRLQVTDTGKVQLLKDSNVVWEKP